MENIISKVKRKMTPWKIIFTTYIMSKGLIYIKDSWKVKKLKVAQLCPTLCNPHGLYSSWNSPGQNPRVNSLSLLQGIVPNQGSNTGLLHCRRILYQLSHKESLRTLCWVAYPFSSRSSQPRNLHQGLLHFWWILYQLSYQESPENWRKMTESSVD